MKHVVSTGILLILIAVGSVQAQQRSKNPPSGSKNVAYPIVQVRKWQVSYTLTANKRFSLKLQNGEVEGYHQPSWSIGGTAILDLGRREDGGFRTVDPNATGCSWSGRTSSSGTFRGDFGVIPGPGIKQGYVGGGSVSTADEDYNSLGFQLSATRGTYDLDLVLELDGHLLTDASELLQKFNELEAQAQGEDAEAGKALLELLKALVLNGLPEGARPFKAMFNPTVHDMPLPASEDGSIPTIKGSKEVQLNLPEAMLGLAWATFSWTLIPLDDKDEPDVAVRSYETAYPHCACGYNKLVEFTAEATLPGGDFERFEIDYDPAKAPVPVRNEGGKKPYLAIKGSGISVGKVQITAVYVFKGKQFRSRPFELNFCQVDKPELPENAFKLENRYYVFNEDDPGELDIEAKTRVWFNGQEVKENSEGWEIQPENINFDREYQQGETRVIFKARGLPERNSDFGPHAIKYTYDDATCRCESEEAEAKVFFNRDARNNPEGKIPNWAYYWRQTKAGLKNVDFEVVKTIPNADVRISLPLLACLGPILTQAGGNTVARYDPVQDVIYIPESLPTIVCANRPSGRVEDEGIDCFAVIIRHERRHQVELTEWWGPNFSRYSCIDDADGDMVPNSVELATEGCSTLIPWSCPSRPTYLNGRIWDVDITAYQAGWQWVPHTADDEDWAYPGHQCGRR